MLRFYLSDCKYIVTKNNYDNCTLHSNQENTKHTTQNLEIVEPTSNYSIIFAAKKSVSCTKKKF